VKGALAQELGAAAAGRAIMRRLAQFLGITGLCGAAFDPIF
jgi:hypothetical protein